MVPSGFTLNASMTEHLHAFVETQVASGRFSTAGELVRAALRTLEQQLKREENRARPQCGRSDVRP